MPWGVPNEGAKQKCITPANVAPQLLFNSDNGVCQLSPLPEPSPQFWGALSTPCVTFRRVVAPLRGPGQSPILPFACCVGSLRSVGRCGRCSCWCRFCVRGAQWSVCRGCAGCGGMCRLRVSGAQWLGCWVVLVVAGLYRPPPGSENLAPPVISAPLTSLRHKSRVRQPRGPDRRLSRVAAFRTGTRGPLGGGSCGAQRRRLFRPA